jgi:hypothetical protein
MGDDIFRVLSPTAILGYGFPEESFQKGIEKKPHLIAVDAGSTDPGPYYLGAGISFTSKAAVKRDLGLIVKAAVETSIPCIIGSAGGCGARPHVNWTEGIIREIASESGLSFRMAIIYADIARTTVQKAMDQGRIDPLYPALPVTTHEIEKCVRIVAQMGAEPVSKALDMGCQIILCGRCYDPVPFAAPAIKMGFQPGLAYHMGKILECAAIAASPGSGRDCVMGTLFGNHFELEALNEKRRFTRVSTAAHTMYEKSDPYFLPGPGGTLDLSETTFAELDGGRVRVSGSQFHPSDKYTVKLEGVKSVGFRTISICGIRDPVLIRCFGTVLDEIKTEIMSEYDCMGNILFHVYGKNGVMGTLEPEKDAVSHELGVVIEVVADAQEQADSLCARIRSMLLHHSYPGRISTAGNLALLYSPSDISCGEVFEFNIYHLMSVEDPVSEFPVEIREVTP